MPYSMTPVPSSLISEISRWVGLASEDCWYRLGFPSPPMIISNWNIKGLGDLDKRVKVCVIFYSSLVLMWWLFKNPNFALLHIVFFAPLGGDSNQLMGGSWLNWCFGWATYWVKWKAFEQICQLSTRFSISVKLREKVTQSTFCVSFVNGPNDRSLKPLFLQELSTIHSWCSSEPWALMRDFNMTRFLHERQGCEGYSVDMDSFNDNIRDLDLIDIPLGRQSFTWSNKRVVSAFAKLDWFLISNAWDDVFSLSFCKALLNTISDHIPISLYTSSNHWCATRFHFETMWLEHQDIHGIMTSAWSFVSHANAAVSLTQKLRKKRSALMMWSKTQFGCVRRKKPHILEMLNKLDVLLESRPLYSDESSLNKLDRISCLEEIMWRQRARSLWLKKVDKNSKIFHRVANARYRYSLIHTLHFQEETLTSHVDISHVLLFTFPALPIFWCSSPSSFACKLGYFLS